MLLSERGQQFGLVQCMWEDAAGLKQAQVGGVFVGGGLPEEKAGQGVGGEGERALSGWGSFETAVCVYVCARLCNRVCVLSEQWRLCLCVTQLERLLTGLPCVLGACVLCRSGCWCLGTGPCWVTLLLRQSCL